jgi:DNA-binding beta-propeller fold protein YncE
MFVGNARHELKRALAILVSACAVLALLASSAAAANQPTPSRPPVNPVGVLVQPKGANGCLVDQSSGRHDCTHVRALMGPGPFVGSEAIAISPDGKNVYVASSGSDAIAVFQRNPSTGALTQAAGTAGCIAAGGANGCATGVGLDGPNSVAVSPDGENVYATSINSNSLAIFTRNPSTGALTQATDGSGCLAATASAGCDAARGLTGADVVAVSPDGRNVYTGSFKGSTVAVFARYFGGALKQLDGTQGCISQRGAGGCAIAIAMLTVEGVAVSGDGNTVYAAAPGSNAVDVLARNSSSGALTQLTGGAGCFTNTSVNGCTKGRWLGGADAVTVSPDGKSVYVAASLTNSVANFTRTPSNGHLAQASGTTGCAIYVLAVACTLGRTLILPEGLTVSPDGANVYVASFLPGSLDTFDRDASTSGLIEKPRKPGCLIDPRFDCVHAQAMRGASSVVVSPDGKNVYVSAFASNAVTEFKRITKR